MAEENDPKFENVYREQGLPVRKYLRLSTGNAAAADDLTQETFLDFWRRGQLFDAARGELKAYLLGIARKKSADWWRARRHRPETGEEARKEATEGLLIRDALARLPEELRSMLWLREVEGHSYQELAEIFHVPVGTVRSRLHTARKELRTMWLKEAK